MPALPAAPSPGSPTALRVAPLAGRAGAPGTLIPAVVGPVQRICEMRTPVPVSVVSTLPETALALSLSKRVRELLLGIPGLIAWQFDGVARRVRARPVPQGGGSG